MGIFIKKYKLFSEKNKEEVIGVFRNHFDDMCQKGYSGSTLILNADHHSKTFSGTYKNGRFIFRHTNNGTDDFYYRILPQNEVTFAETEGGTDIYVKSKSIFGIILCCCLLAVAVFPLLLLFSAYKVYARFALIPLGLAGAATCFVRSIIHETKLHLMYIYQ